MGTGASTTATEKLKDAAQEDVKVALAGLPAEDQAKLQTALRAVSGGSSAGQAECESDAPFLKQAFKLLSDSFKDMIEKGATFEGGDIEEMEKAMQDTHAKAKELMAKSFDHHDKAGSGSLDKDEAAVFFKNLLQEQGGLMESLTEIEMKSAADQWIKDLKKSKELPDDEKAEMIIGLKKGLEETVAEVKKNVAEASEDYKANKAERDAAAFKVVDTAGDGTLSKAEFLDAFTWGSEKNNKLFQALQLPMC